MTFIKNAPFGLALLAMLATAMPASADRLKPGHIIAGAAGVALLAHILNERDRSGQARAAATPRRHADRSAFQPRRLGWSLGSYRQCARLETIRGRERLIIGPRCVRQVNRSVVDNPRAYHGTYVARPPEIVRAAYGACIRERTSRAGVHTFLGPRCVARVNDQVYASQRHRRPGLSLTFNNRF